MIVDGKGRARIGVRLELTHIVADAGQALKPTIVVEETLDGGGIHSLFAHQIQHDTGIDLARSRPHRQAIERGKAHRALDAPAFEERAHGRAAA